MPDCKLDISVVWPATVVSKDFAANLPSASSFVYTSSAFAFVSIKVLNVDAVSANVAFVANVSFTYDWSALRANVVLAVSILFDNAWLPLTSSLVNVFKLLTSVTKPVTSPFNASANWEAAWIAAAKSSSWPLSPNASFIVLTVSEILTIVVSPVTGSTLL